MASRSKSSVAQATPFDAFISALPSRLRTAVPGAWPGSWPATARAGNLPEQGIWARLAVLVPAYFVATLILRAVTLGDPVIHIDEQFYLLVGDRMLHGAVPFVDIWDRKPIGLFLIYAAIRLLGGDGIIQYQLVALAFAASTAVVIHLIARQIASNIGAWCAGIGYLLYLSAFNCFGGQAPVFFNLPMALAALGLCGSVTSVHTEKLLWRGAVVMLLTGIAIQIKYTAVFEGFAFGMALMGRGWAAGWRRPRMILATLLWASIALAPTALALGIYAAMGHGAAFIHANFISIFQRQEPFAGALWRLVKEMVVLFPFWLAIFHAPRKLGLSAPHTALRGTNPRALPVLRYWAIAAFVGFIAFGTWYDHYVAPLLAPLAVLAAPAMGRWLPGSDDTQDNRASKIYSAIFIGFGLIAASYMTLYQMSKHGNRAEVDHSVSLIRDELDRPGNTGCLYLNEGDPVLYHLTGSCLATPWIFPTHLAGTVDAKALGFDPMTEMNHLLSAHPAVVVVSQRPLTKPPNERTRRYLLAELARHYERYATTRIGARDFDLYRPRRAAGAAQ